MAPAHERVAPAGERSPLADHTLVHFKGPTDELERDDARMLLAYALQYLVVAGIDDPALVALRVVAAQATPRFLQGLRSLGCVLTAMAAGVHEGRLGVFPIRVVETVRANDRAGEHLLYTVTPGMLADPDGFPALSAEEIDIVWALREHVQQIRHPLPGQQRRHMKDEAKMDESVHAALTRLFKRLPVEERLAGLAPEERLAGMSEAEAVLALPETMLRALSKEYLATLPAETQAAVQRRLRGAPAPASPRPRTAGSAARSKQRATGSRRPRG